jgi:hypothetical protein
MRRDRKLEKMSYAHKMLSCKREHKRKMGLFRHMLDANIEIKLKKTVCNNVGWIRLAQDRV